MGGHGGCRVSEVRAGTTSPMPDNKGIKLQLLVNFQKFSASTTSPMPDNKGIKLQLLVNFQKFSTLRVKAEHD